MLKFCSVFGHFPAKLPQDPIKRVRLEKCCWGHGSPTPGPEGTSRRGCHLRVTLTWILIWACRWIWVWIWMWNFTGPGPRVCGALGAT